MLNQLLWGPYVELVLALSLFVFGVSRLMLDPYPQERLTLKQLGYGLLCRLFLALPKTVQHALFYNYRNLTRFRVALPHPCGDRMRRAIASGTIDVMKRHITDAYLATVGLRVVDENCDTVPWYIYLTRIQREWVKAVGQYGYKAGLPD